MAGKKDLVPDPTVIGEISAPPFVQLPDPGALFARRAERLRFLGSVSPLKPYLEFIADLSEAQSEIAAGLGPVAARHGDDRGRDFGMPAIDRADAISEPALGTVFDRLFEHARTIAKPQDAADALERVANSDAGARRRMIEAVFAGILPPEAIAEHIYVWAGLQLHFTRLAAALDSKSLKPVADGVCPTCGSIPSSSMVVGWHGAHGARFCSCSVCNTLWHYVRVKCVCCGSTKGIGYKEVEEGGGIIKAETCDECQRWVKIIYQQLSADADPMTDDIASLGLDILMRETPYRRGGFSPLLAGL
ncbi:MULTISPECIES: formate dehydrogenase accessory protein FdhE [Brucella]|jgi:FdhE protein|uniref:Formate dehydrogenase accessory protein FdhE n=1 Tax=Brucella anthropi TaxID=529 RepID=A0A011UGX5_BRUAN|nr:MULTISPECIES: formate dehydrogenase accessory protein FdhE [Brucella]QTN05536.1 formate dehydrogenase accessory protein FdhE [Ochrobactrum sp. EEELCW01]EXL05153.1 formate dehydrogenase [Brucella anthropi]KAB2768242.1 formate dehydrogenase accessory protein FdhE [Brucella anthropi]KAB2797428.1 formate dehydrogenase accessory protein FdhE [Brucella anthropi]MBE0559619.1 formate dehydrogenase accessory protein FdhE [Brucella anthropi]